MRWRLFFTAKQLEYGYLNMAHTNSLIMPFSSQSPAKPVDSDLTNIHSESTQELDDIDDDNANEQSPLLPPNGSPTDGTVPSPLEDVVEWLGDAYESKSSGYMFLLTLGIFGYVFYYN